MARQSFFYRKQRKRNRTRSHHDSRTRVFPDAAAQIPLYRLFRNFPVTRVTEKFRGFKPSRHVEIFFKFPWQVGNRPVCLKVKGTVKIWVLVIALFTRLEQQRFTISEVAADWHEIMIPWRIIRPSIARDGEQLDPRCSTQTYHRPNQNTRPSPFSPWATTHFPSRWQ